MATRPPVTQDASPKFNKSDSFKYWRSVEEGSKQIVAAFNERGTLDVDGAAYFDPLDIEEFAGPDVKKPATLVGVSYQIASLTAINSVEETFKVVIDMNIMFRILDTDIAKYEEYKGRGTISFQDLCDDPGIKSNPPIWEIRNAVSSPELLRERVVAIMQCWDHRAKAGKGEWGWYVTLFVQLRCDCYEEFEMENFPFTKNSLQVSIQVKQDFKQFVLVPYNCRSAMPHWAVRTNPQGEKEVVEVGIRGNTFKNDKTISNWIVESHHVAFIPREISAPMPSGNKFSTCVITIQCKQNCYFYLANTLPVVVFLPVLTGAAVLENYCKLADRLSIVLALLLTMATYKVSISSWIPQKDYLTRMDKYIIAGFVWILAIGVIIGITSVLIVTTGGDIENNPKCAEPEANATMVSAFQDGAKELPELLESVLVTGLIVAWVVAHVILMCRLDSFYDEWPAIMKAENESLKEICDAVTEERDILTKVKFCDDVMPKPPGNAQQPK